MNTPTTKVRGNMTPKKPLTVEQLNNLRRGDFAILQDLDLRCRVQNVRTGYKSRPCSLLSALRMQRRAASRL